MMAVESKKCFRVVQELATAMLQSAQLTCPRVVQRSSVSEHLADRVAKKTRQAAHFIQNTMQEAENSIKNKLWWDIHHYKQYLTLNPPKHIYIFTLCSPLSLFLSELKLSVSVSLVESIIEEVLQDLSVAQEKLVSVCIYERVYCAHENCVYAYMTCNIYLSCFQDKHMREFSQSTNIKANVPQLRVMEHEFPTDDVRFVLAF